jgi:hypothetical protein
VLMLLGAAGTGDEPGHCVVIVAAVVGVRSHSGFA